MLPTDEDRLSYKRGRAALRDLRKGRDFTSWLDYANAVDTAQREAMRAAAANNPVGKAYNAEFARVVKREKLVEHLPDGKQFPDPTTRKDCAAMLRNYEFAVDDPRRISVKTWRGKLDSSDRAKLNHPGSVMRRWRADTEPQEDKEAAKAAREARAPREDPLLTLVADTELERDAARHDAQTLRQLLARVREEAGEHLSPELLDAIAEALS